MDRSWLFLDSGETRSERKVRCHGTVYSKKITDGLQRDIS